MMMFFLGMLTGVLVVFLIAEIVDANFDYYHNDECDCYDCMDEREQ